MAVRLFAQPNRGAFLSEHPEKPGYVYRVTDCDWLGRHPEDGGLVLIGFVTSGGWDVHLELTPAALLSLEARLAKLRDEMAGGRPLQ